MSFLHRLRLHFSPPKIIDPDFGSLRFMYIPNAPDRSCWEAEWVFPPTGTAISIGLAGTEAGPTEAARSFYLGLPAKFDAILVKARPLLDQVFESWLKRPLATDPWADLKLAGFDVDNPAAHPLVWDVTFETLGEKWLAITIPFLDESPGEPVIDT